jgi:hypothetical protein
MSAKQARKRLIRLARQQGLRVFFVPLWLLRLLSRGERVWGCTYARTKACQYFGHEPRGKHSRHGVPKLILVRWELDDGAATLVLAHELAHVFAHINNGLQGRGVENEAKVVSAMLAQELDDDELSVPLEMGIDIISSYQLMTADPPPKANRKRIRKAAKHVLGAMRDDRQNQNQGGCQMPTPSALQAGLARAASVMRLLF